jgi:uncharacterized membrane protein YqjE
MTPEPSKSAGDLLSEVLDNITGLFRSEVELARAEMMQSVTGASSALVAMAVSLGLVLTGLNAAAVGCVALIVAADHPVMPASFAVAAGFILLALIIFFAAKAKLSSVKLIPVRAKTNVQQDVAAVKEAYRDTH